jgi:hypothetical protein
MRRPFCCDASRSTYEDYYSNQQRGGGSTPVYGGVLSQRGHGIGNMIGSLFRRALPTLLRRGAAAALRTGANVVDDIQDKKQIKDSLKKRIPEGLKGFATSLFGQSGRGLCKRKTRRKKRGGKKRSAKKRKIDIFS